MEKFFNMTNINIKQLSKELLIFIAFLLLTLTLRFKSFNYSILDWDESLYFMWAKDLFHGVLPYETIMENKPIGISLVYAMGFIIFGFKSMLSIKLLALFFVSASAYTLYKIGLILNPNNSYSGALAGIFYCIFSCYNLGVSENTEIFFTFFVVYAFYLLFKNLQDLSNLNFTKYSYFFLIGLSLGIAFLIKYVVLFDTISVAIIVAISIFLKPSIDISKKINTLSKLLFFILLGLILPQIFVLLTYCIKGKLHFLINSFLFTIKYGSSIPWNLKNMLISLLHNINNYKLLVYALFLFIFIKKLQSNIKINLFYILIWFLIILFELLFFLTHCWPHYYIQLLPPLCLLSSFLIVNCFTIITNKKIIIFLFIAIVFGLILSYQQAIDYINSYLSWRDKSKLEFEVTNGKITPLYKDPKYYAAEYINKNIGTGKYIFVLSEDYILYDMTNSKHTSKYAMPAQIMETPFDKIFDKKLEIEKIMKDKPIYIILPGKKSEYFYTMFHSNKLVFNLISKYISKDYTYDKEFGSNILYRRSAK